MSLYKCLTCFAVLWIALPALSAPVGAAIHEAHVDGGMIIGSINNGVSSFKGIPFAAAPIGPLRWKAPQAVIPWNGIRRTASFGLPCAQTPVNEDQSSEDCLFLNVWTGAADPAERRPVMVWIHGGVFNWGATRSSTFDGSRFAGQGVVLVSVAWQSPRAAVLSIMASCRHSTWPRRPANAFYESSVSQTSRPRVPLR